MMNLPHFAEGRIKKSSSDDNYSALLVDNKNLINYPVEAGKRTSLDWNYFAILPDGDGTLIKFPDLSPGRGGRLILRLLTALEIRDKREISVSLGGSGKAIWKSFPIWYASCFQIFEIELTVNAEELKREGLRLKVTKGDIPVYCYTFDKQRPGSHLYQENDTSAVRDSYFDKLFSLWSVQPFGWMEGCVTDGLYALAATGKFPTADKTLDRHLKLFFPDNKQLKYEWYDSSVRDNIFNNHEGGLPFAALAKKNSTHSALELFTDFCESRIENGSTTAKSLTTEGVYHLAYPLMVVAEAKKYRLGYDIALIEIIERINLLGEEERIHQGASKDKSSTQFTNWSRGYAWLLLGLVRCFGVIKNENTFKNDHRLKMMREAFEHYANIAMKTLRNDGSWGAYLDSPDTPFDASGTAGIASALLYASRFGWNVDFGEQDRKLVIKCLERSLTPDGFLKENCQVNRGGEELQRSDFRVISQYAMGLMAHLYT